MLTILSVALCWRLLVSARARLLLSQITNSPRQGRHVLSSPVGSQWANRFVSNNNHDVIAGVLKARIKQALGGTGF